ncbi:MAG: EAL domain-containing protein [Betaproteobacteria bacterium]
MNATAILAGKIRPELRLRSFALAGAAYGISFLLLILAYAVKLIGFQGVIASAVLILLVNLAFYSIFKLGLNKRAVDSSLMLAQTLAAIAVVMFIAYQFERNRSLALAWCLVVMLFGVFRFKPRDFAMTTLFMLAGYGLVINLLMSFKPAQVDVYIEWFQWMWLALILPAFAWIGSRISVMRARILRSNEELTNALATIQDMATHDSLTGLPNRASLSDLLQHAVNKSDRNESELAVFFIDLDNFKSINDTLGHPTGDQLLREMARRIRASIRESDLVARLGGDEFVVMTESVADRAGLQLLATKILLAISEPAQLQQHEVKVTASIGIAKFPMDGKDVPTLLANADMAMYRAKAQGRARAAEYSADLGDDAVERFEIEKGMRSGMQNHEFHLYYQPKIEFSTGKMLGVEALIRWHHPTLGVLGPDRFIPIAESTNFILPLGKWVIDEACRQSRAWQDANMPLFPIAVNLSVNQLADPSLSQHLSDALRISGANPRMIELEITETAVMRNLDEAIVILESFRALGVRLAIDDFGTGYSSLAYLKQLPVDILKVDRAFVKGLPHNRDDLAITRAVIAMAHGLSMKVVAEGVEEKHQFDSLRDEGCDEFQGFYCRAAMKNDVLEGLLRKHGLVIPVDE